jgi:SAM-dependent methyltransferase
LLAVPQRFNRNAREVQAMGTPADTGLILIRYMCERLGIADLAGLDVLDFGCGSRFAEAIIAHDIRLRSYVGIDVNKEMIDFLSENVTDTRLSFFHFGARNPLYNPAGVPLSPSIKLPSEDRSFDLICMFSVITHQTPEDAAAIFKILRRQVREEAGSLFFSACLLPGDFGYRENDPSRPTALSIYSANFLTRLLGDAGWRVISIVPPACDDLILDSFVCAPV